MHGSPNHDDLRVESHVILPAEGDSPVKDRAEVMVEGPVNGLLHNL